METVLQFRSWFESLTEQNCLVVNQLLIRSALSLSKGSEGNYDRLLDEEEVTSSAVN